MKISSKHLVFALCAVVAFIMSPQSDSFGVISTMKQNDQADRRNLPQIEPKALILKFKSPESLSQTIQTQKGVTDTSELNPQLPGQIMEALHRKASLELRGDEIKNEIPDLSPEIKSLVGPETILKPISNKIYNDTRTQRLNNRPLPEKLDKVSNIYMLTNISLKEGKTIKDLSEELPKEDPNLEYAEPNAIAYTTYVPNDLRYPYQWAHKKTQAELGWDVERGNPNVVIAVVDTGVDYNHEDLNANIWHDADGHPGKDFVDVNFDDYGDCCTFWPEEDYVTVDDDPSDFNGHGTHVAGIAATVMDNEKGVAGTCPNCETMPVRAGFHLTVNYVGTFGVLEYDDVFNAIIYAADNNADVINMSFGGPYSQTIKAAVDYAFAQESILVAAAGNSSSSELMYPAAYDHVIAVGATARDDAKAWYSSYGPWVDIAAPGGDGGKDSMILSTVPTVIGRANLGHPLGYRRVQGTSMATPYIAGSIALLKSAHPDWSNDLLEPQLLNTTDWVDSPQGQIGSGRVNLNRMLTRRPLQPRAMISGLSISDSGNDGKLDPGETVTLDLTLKSMWFPAQGVAATLQPKDERIKMLTTHQYFGDIPLEIPVTRSFSFSISPCILPSEPIAYDVEFILKVGMVNGEKDVQSFSLHVEGLKNSIAQPQQYGWAITAGGAEFDQTSGVAFGEAGNIYAAGQFSGSFDFDPTEGIDIPTFAGGNWDIFITKLNADHSYGWTQTIGGEGSEAARALTADSYGNVLITGEFLDPSYQQYTLDFDPTEGIDMHTVPADKTGTFITKLGADGSYRWTKIIVMNVNLPTDIVTDPDGSVIITGSFTGTVDFDPSVGGVDMRTSIAEDVFVTKLNADGSYAWTRTFGGSSNQIGMRLAVDLSGNISVVGNFGSVLNVPGFSQVASNGLTDVFLVEIDTNGNFLSVQTVGGSGADMAFGVAEDTKGNTIVAGFFSNTVDLDPTAGEDVRTSNGHTDIFVTKWGPSGEYLWSRTFGGVEYDGTRDVGVDANGNVFVGGMFGDVVDFDPGPAADLHVSVGGPDVFLTKLGPNGEYLRTSILGDTSAFHWNEIKAVDVDRNGNVVMGGVFSYSQADFDPGEGEDIRIPNNGSADLFIVQLKKPNAAPVLNPIGSKSVAVGRTLRFKVKATDEDNDNLRFAQPQPIDLPRGASFEIVYNEAGRAEGLFQWTPVAGQEGVYSAPFAVSDGALVDSETVLIRCLRVSPD